MSSQRVTQNVTGKNRAAQWQRAARDVLGEDTDKYERFVESRLRGLVSASPVMDHEDIVQDGWEGLCRAAVAYEEGHDADVKTLAYHRIRGQAQDQIRVRNGTRRYRLPTASLDRLLDAPAFPDPADTDLDDPDGRLARRKLIRAVQTLLWQLDQPVRRIMELTVQGHQPAPIARHLEMTEAEVRRFQTEGRDYLRFQLEKQGVTSSLVSVG